MSPEAPGFCHGAPPRGTPAPPEQALEWLDATTAALAGEDVAVAAAHGRVLARPVHADVPLPATALAGCNGYAVHARATTGAGSYSPLRLRLRAGGRAALAVDEAVAVASGVPLPEGADGVLPRDEAEAFGPALEVYGAVAAGEHVVAPGAEAAAGDAVLVAGRRLRAHDLSQLAALGLEAVTVVRRPRVRLVAAPGSALAAGDAAGVMLEVLVGRDGGLVEGRGFATDGAALDGLMAAPGADLTLVYGGSGDGDGDFAGAALGRGGALEIHGVAINPGETVGLGRCAGRPVMLLPGAPLACLCAYEFLAGRAVRRLAGGGGDWPYAVRRATLRRKVASRLGRLEFCRVRLEEDGAIPLAVSDGRLLASAVAAEGFVVIPLHSEGYPEGTEVRVHVYQ